MGVSASISRLFYTIRLSFADGPIRDTIMVLSTEGENMARILIVDDEPTIVEMLNTLLKTDGHEVISAIGGVKAKEILEREDSGSFDLMISDIRMNPIDGMELLKFAREIHPTTSVVMLTAYGQVETAIEALQLGAFDYIAKPFKVDKLLGTIHRALECRNYMEEELD